ncbi:MAG: glucosidase [Pirellulaceae bacterium]|nr:glucosidase [Pirellulaceae bacterium]
MYLHYNHDGERARLRETAARERNWSRWGPYLSERQWATVREDYSASGDSWGYFSHEQARSRAYRWGEDGLLGITDRQCRLCFSVALWNERDTILKERLFGLTGPQGNHGEDVKELYYYLDASPTAAYLKALYKYPQAAYPYQQLVERNRALDKLAREYEITDGNLFADGRYFDVFAEYAKASPEDILIRLTIANRGPEARAIHVLPTLWFRNTWVWGCRHEGCTAKPRIWITPPGTLETWHESFGPHQFAAGVASDGTPHEWLFTDNETNNERLFKAKSLTPYVKDAFHDYVVQGRKTSVNPKKIGTKVAAHYRLTIPAGGQVEIPLRLAATGEKPAEHFGPEFGEVLAKRRDETTQFYGDVLPRGLAPDETAVARQGYAGLVWTKQFYHYIVEDWLQGDPETPTPPAQRKTGRNHDWPHLFNRDVISMPDKWEYPWYAAWDLAFHMVPFCRFDADFAKEQLCLFLREWYMHPNGQIPAYEFNLSDVNPPVHAWGCWRVYKLATNGNRDRKFLESVFQKLLLNFTWWVNRKDPRGKHLFAGGFLGLDNIGVFDRSRELPTGGHLEQADGTAWMAFYCSTMLAMALEIAQAEEHRANEDIASKFFEHFVHIVDAMNTLGGTGLWDEEDGFYYDQLIVDGATMRLKVRSMVGLIPLFACEVLEDEQLQFLGGFRKRFEWFRKFRPQLAKHLTFGEAGEGEFARGRWLLAIPSRERLVRVLKYMLDENEFLSPFGIRSLSKIYEKKPYVFTFGGQRFEVGYVPGESDSNLFGGNSNWRGPIWFPVNYLIIEALQRYHYFYGDSLQVECPTGSGNLMNLRDVSLELCRRLNSLFLPDAAGNRPCHGGDPLYRDQHFRDLPLFYEYFHGDNGRGLGASHQTGWTALVLRCLDMLAPTRKPK